MKTGKIGLNWAAKDTLATKEVLERCHGGLSAGKRV